MNFSIHVLIIICSSSSHLSETDILSNLQLHYIPSILKFSDIRFLYNIMNCNFLPNDHLPSFELRVPGANRNAYFYIRTPRLYFKKKSILNRVSTQYHSLTNPPIYIPKSIFIKVCERKLSSYHIFCISLYLFYLSLQNDNFIFLFIIFFATFYAAS